MDELLLKLSERMERIEANQELILQRLNEVNFYPKLKGKTPSSKTRKERKKDEIEEMATIIMQGTRIRNEFNLLQTPSPDRIRTYLKSGNPAAFDGLKRKS